VTVACLAAVLCVACVRSEPNIRTDVRERLDADQTLAGLDLSIEVKKRVVYLSGRTFTEEQQQRAIAAARGRGIKLVVNHMSLTNSALIDKVKQALAADETIGKIPIDVDAEGTIVRLMSDKTNSDERERAVQVASAVEGVTQVLPLSHIVARCGTAGPSDRQHDSHEIHQLRHRCPREIQIPHAVVDFPHWRL
jgi:osmotically-inducible protein OsmY